MNQYDVIFNNRSSYQHQGQRLSGAGAKVNTLSEATPSLAHSEEIKEIEHRRIGI